MAQLGMNFDASRVQPFEPGLPVWEGRVPIVVMRTEIKATAANDGNSFLALHVQALDAPYRGQEQVIRLNLYNKNAQAVNMAQSQLSSICHVTGRMNVTDSDQLIGAPFIGVWAKETRELTDQTTGQKRNVESCQCKDFQLIDGRTIKEAMAGQAASTPYVPGQTGLQEAAARAGQAPAAQAPAPQPAPPSPGFQPPQGAPQPQGGFAPPQAQSAPVSGSAPGSSGSQQAPTPHSPGFGTAASPSSGFTPPQPHGAPQGGFAPPPAGGAPQGGFGPPAGAPAAQPGFTPPAAGQTGAGPWSGAPQGGFGPRQ